ncbi:hypothetical protein [Streptomyces sp. H27-C3]|uniref:hypothetical protein n=1 Tax=Streptomyces sp. H27-C3 TaxID=3046305 RepID=UPI0024B88888|nr:hypothetical protein [Streptomyces sp. H27-C3]MDJ0466118.1 hypothetical protein [Streptomyces sp. H27-C3]
MTPALLAPTARDAQRAIPGGAVAERAEAPAPRRGRGRPLLLDGPERIEEFLAYVAAGWTVLEALGSMGLSRSRTPVYTLRRQDPLFAVALAEAQKKGRAARRQSRSGETQMDQHGTESSYKRRRCSCGACREAASRARRKRRQAQGADGTSKKV